MGILVSGKNKGCVIDTEGTYIGGIVKNHSRFGYAWDDEYIYAPTNKGVMKLDPTKRLVDFFEYKIDDPHQSILHNNKLLITNTMSSTNSLIEFNIQTKEFKKLPISGTWINSISLIDNHYYILDHAKGPSLLCKYDLDYNLIEKYSIGKFAHNIWKMDGDIWICSSGEKKLISLSGKEIPIKGYARGIAMTDEFLYVGISSFRTSDSHHILFDDQDRQNGILTLDRGANYQISDFHPLPIEGISDLKVLFEEDRATHYTKPLNFLGLDMPELAILVATCRNRELVLGTLTAAKSLLEREGINSIIIRPSDETSPASVLFAVESALSNRLSPIVYYKDKSIMNLLKQLEFSAAHIEVIEDNADFPIDNASRLLDELMKGV